MIFKSKMIYDPTRWLPSNRMGRTIGLVFHTPKYWDCKKYDFYVSQFDEMHGGRPLTDEEMESRYLSKKAHEKCKRKHLSYRGYLYWIGPKRRYQFNFMGRPYPVENGMPKWGYVRKHGLYTRLLDNGPQSEKQKPLFDDPKFARLMTERNQKFTEVMAASRRQMQEYERMREGRA